MKRIVIITDRKRIAEKIREDLLCVFRGKAELETLTFEEIAKMEQSTEIFSCSLWEIGSSGSRKSSFTWKILL